jgi:hypothetical protein
LILKKYDQKIMVKMLELAGLGLVAIKMKNKQEEKIE